MTTSLDRINLPLTPDQLTQVLDGNVVRVEVPDADTGKTAMVVFVRLAANVVAHQIGAVDGGPRKADR